MNWIVVPVVLLGAGALLYVGRCFTNTVGWNKNPWIAKNLRYQPLALIIGFVAVVATQLLVPGHANFLQIGSWDAPAQGLGWLGVSDGDSWIGIGLTFLVIMTLVTAVVIWFQLVRGSGIRLSMLLRALPWAIAFSVTNALSEELLFRVTVAEALAPVVSITVVATASAVLFGLPHWFGNPGRIPGVILAGFMGWFLAFSVVQTAGIGWAFVIHFAQDVVIISVLIARAARETSST